MTLKTPMRICLIAALTVTCYPAVADGRYYRGPVGTWSVALDAGPFGLPGFTLAGVASFHRGGTLSLADAGDWGGLGTLDSNQFGVWRWSRSGLVATTVFLSADAESGDVRQWQRVTLKLRRGESRDHLEGHVNVAILLCEPASPVPSALTCPDPVERRLDFTPIPPFDVPVALRRLEVESN